MRDWLTPDSLGEVIKIRGAKLSAVREQEHSSKARTRGAAKRIGPKYTAAQTKCSKLGGVEHWIEAILGFSYIGVFLVVFAETGLLVGAALPGDSLLIAAGLLAANQKGNVQLNLGLLILSIVTAAFLGSLVGYWIGKRFGPGIFSRQDSRFFKPEYLVQAQEFFAKEGPKAVMLARFIPFVRAVIPTLAGVSGMPFGPYVLYSALGAILWGAGLPALAYWVGQRVPNLDHYILLIVGVVLLVSFVPIAMKFLGRKKAAPTQVSQDSE